MSRIVAIVTRFVTRFVTPFSVEVDIDGKITQPALNMDTLLLEPNALQMSLVWRGAVPCDKKSLKIRHIRIDMLS